MKMSEEMAIKLHRMMWSDMQKELGDTPDLRARNKFKEKWCAFHFPDDHISFNCFRTATGQNRLPVRSYQRDLGSSD